MRASVPGCDVKIKGQDDTNELKGPNDKMLQPTAHFAVKIDRKLPGSARLLYPRAVVCLNLPLLRLPQTGDRLWPRRPVYRRGAPSHGGGAAAPRPYPLLRGWHA